MQSFAKRVCTQPEVKCVTYKELLAFTEANKAKIPNYKAGAFTKMPRPPSAGDDTPVEEAVDDALLDAEGIVRDSAEAHAEEAIDELGSEPAADAVPAAAP